MIEHENQPHVCYNCDEEFVVTTPYETEVSVEFCPFCGSEVEGNDDTLLFDEEDPDSILDDE